MKKNFPCAICCLSGSSAERGVTGDCQRSETDIRLLTGLRPLPLFMEPLPIGGLAKRDMQTYIEQQKERNNIMTTQPTRPQDAAGSPDLNAPAAPGERFSLFGAGINKPSGLVPHIREATLRDVYRWMNTMRMKELTDKLRSIGDERGRKLFKASRLPFATFSGTFSRRCAEGLISHSSLLCFDFDHLGDSHEVMRVKLLLVADPYFETRMAFTSPSGDGLKWITQVDLERGTHEQWYRAIRNYLQQQYGLSADPAPSSVVSACFLCFDANVMVGEDIAAF